MVRPFPLVLAASCFAHAAAQSPLEDVVKSFAPFDLDGDGRAEVRELRWREERGQAGKPLVVVLVERRLWRPESTLPAAAKGLDQESLRLPLLQFVRDIAEEGRHVLLLTIDVHAGPPHQDGRTVLAMRRLLQRMHAVAPMQASRCGYSLAPRLWWCRRTGAIRSTRLGRCSPSRSGSECCRTS